jgi:hypothetical protein
MYDVIIIQCHYQKKKKTCSVSDISAILTNVRYFEIIFENFDCLISEQRDMKMKKKHIQQQLKQEDQMLQLSRRWATEVLPNWELM